MRRSIIWFALLTILLTFCAVPLSSPAPTTALTTTPTPISTQDSGVIVSRVSISDVQSNPDAFRDKPVRMQGYGIIMATMPLCPGYAGLDRRAQFMDSQRALITAVLRWQPPANVRLYDPNNLRVFRGYVRIFSGQIGCPGTIKEETFPYFEILEIE